MSIPADVLDTMPPQPFAHICAGLRDGDIVLCQGRDRFSRLIQWSTKSPWSHVGLVFRVEALDQVIVIEAVEKIGVRAVALGDFLSRDSAGNHPYPGKILFVRHREIKGDASDPKVIEIARFAFSRLGSKFAPNEITKIAMRIIDARLFGNRKTPKLLIPDDEYICSEFVAGALASAGLAIPWDGLGFVAPSDIANDPRLFPLFQADVAHPPRQYGAERRRRRKVAPAPARGQGPRTARGAAAADPAPSSQLRRDRGG